MRIIYWIIFSDFIYWLIYLFTISQVLYKILLKLQRFALRFDTLFTLFFFSTRHFEFRKLFKCGFVIPKFSFCRLHISSYKIINHNHLFLINFCWFFPLSFLSFFFPFCIVNVRLYRMSSLLINIVFVSD